MAHKPFVVVGAGGHGRVVAEALRSSGRKVAAFLDSNRALWGTAVDGTLLQGASKTATITGA